MVVEDRVPFLVESELFRGQVLVDLAYVIISAGISPSDGTVLGHGRASILRGREHGLP